MISEALKCNSALTELKIDCQVMVIIDNSSVRCSSEAHVQTIK